MQQVKKYKHSSCGLVYEVYWSFVTTHPFRVDLYMRFFGRSLLHGFLFLVVRCYTALYVFPFRVALGLFITVLITMVIVYYKHKWSKRRTRVRRIAG